MRGTTQSPTTAKTLRVTIIAESSLVIIERAKSAKEKVTTLMGQRSRGGIYPSHVSDVTVSR